MKRFLLAGAAACAGVLIAGPAHASDLYGAVRVGTALDNEASAFGTSLDLSDGRSIAGAVGVSFDNGLEFELGVEHATANLNLGFADFDAEATTPYLNAHFVFFRQSAGLRPYAIVGYVRPEADVGMALGSIEGDGDGWQYGAGVTFPLAGVRGDVRLLMRSTDLSFNGTDVEHDALRAEGGIRF